MNMIRNKSLPIFLCALFCAPFGSAQVTRIRNVDFGKDAVSLTPPMLIDGAPIEDIFSRWGIHFGSTSGAVPRLRQGVVGDIIITPPYLPAIRNEGISGSSANAPLIMNFSFPVRKVGFQLGNGGQNVKSLIRAFDAPGNLLGSIEDNNTDAFLGPFTGIETAASQGISKLSIDYGSSEKAEQVYGLIVEFVARPKFTLFLPQVADGHTPTSLIQTFLEITNPSTLTASVQVHLFDKAGAALSLVFAGTVTNSFNTTIPPFGFKSFVSGGLLTPAVGGYAVIESDVPVDPVAVFRVFGTEGGVISEAGIVSVNAGIFAVGGVRRAMTDDVNTAIAIVNISSLENLIFIRIYNESGQVPASYSTLQILKLAPREQIARFISELFPALQSQDFKGSVSVSSSQPIAAALLRTRAGLPVASVPAGLDR
jgi:hypothetical protein